MIKNVVLCAVVGALAGALLAEFYPELGMGKGEKFVNEVGWAFGKDKPYVKNASIGAAVGALIGFLSRK